MNIELKNAIIATVQEHAREYQLVNFTIQKYREYIYDKDGNYLIGGGEVANFITNFTNLYKNQ